MHSIYRCFPLFAALALVVGEAGTAQPRIFFSDLESGPKHGGENNLGAYITLYGKGFGASRGDSSVTVGNASVASYPIWTDTKITFQLGSAAATGDIVVTTAAGVSNPMPFTVRTGKIYFVATNGADGNKGSFASPWRSLLKARDSLKPGDIVYVMDGVVQNVDDGQGRKTCMLLRT